MFQLCVLRLIDWGKEGQLHARPLREKCCRAFIVRLCCGVQFTGQPVLIGGTMGTCSYVLTGTEKVSGWVGNG